MKTFSFLVSGIWILALLSCASTHKTSSSVFHGSADTAYGLPDSLRDGSSFERSIVIKETAETPGVAAEYKWIRDNEPGYRTMMQSLRSYKGRAYDVLHIKNEEGTEKDIYFDISRFFGKF